MIPLRDVIPSRTTPYITITIIAINALAWFFEIALPREALPEFIQVVEIPAIVLLGFWFLMQLVSAGEIAATAGTHGSGGVAFAAHVAGFLVGMGGVFVFRKREPAEQYWA